MKKLKEQLKSVSKSLTSLSKQVERISGQLAKLQDAKKKPAKKAATRKTPAKRKVAAAKKPAKKAAAAKGTTVLDTVLNVIKRSKKGVSIDNIRAKTKLEARQLSNALYKLSKKGQIAAKSRGIYVKK